MPKHPHTIRYMKKVKNRRKETLSCKYTNRVVEREVLVANLGEQHALVLFLEGWIATQQDEQYDPKGPTFVVVFN